ncbi:unnamed protein product [Heterobilharzia americana]|nr:unnamed protein product [Heterobilharzia americana]
MIWHYPMGTIQVTFKVNRNKQPIITDHQTFANNNNNHNNNLNHEIYFNAIGTEDKILYLTFHTTLIEEKVGEHKFTLINRKTKQSFESMIINVIAKKTQEANKQMETTANTSHDLHKYKTVCNGNIHFCSVIYMAGSNIICERDDTSVLSKIKMHSY